MMAGVMMVVILVVVARVVAVIVVVTVMVVKDVLSHFSCGLLSSPQPLKLWGQPASKWLSCHLSCCISGKMDVC